jgi:hypothetical protein
MNKITVFYHIYIPGDIRAQFWNWWIDEQLGLIEKSGLSKVANVRLYITMPTQWTELGVYTFGSFRDIVKEYIDLRYNFVQFIQFRDVSEENIYEGATLIPMWEYSQSNPDDILVYIHTKGVLSAGVQSKCWREMLNEVIINQWQMRLYDIKDNDAVGVMSDNITHHFSGNFFWTKARYVATLPIPAYTNRYFYENWIMLNKPKYKVAFHVEANLYLETIIYNKIITKL